MKKRIVEGEITELVLSDMRMTVCRNLSARSAEMGGVRSKTSHLLHTARFSLAAYFCRSSTWISIPVSARCVDRNPRHRSPLVDSVFALVWWFSSFARESTKDVACHRIHPSMDRMWHESDDWSSLDERSLTLLDLSSTNLYYWSSSVYLGLRRANEEEVCFPDSTSN